MTANQATIRNSVNPERHRRAVEQFINSAEPYRRALVELEMSQPLQYIQKPDGTMEKIKYGGWSPAAVQLAAQLEEMIEIIKRKAFEDASGIIPLR